MGDMTRIYTHLKEGKVQPIAIPLRQMEMFIQVSSGDQEGLEYYGPDAFDWRKGEKVRVIDGRFKGLEGEIKRIDGSKRLIVAIEGICCVATTYIPRCFLEKLWLKIIIINMNLSKVMLSGALAIVLLSATSCKTPSNIAYFQDLNNNPDTVITLQNRVITVKPTDKLYIGVKSKDPQISQLFNLTGGTSSGATNMSQDAYY